MQDSGLLAVIDFPGWLGVLVTLILWLAREFVGKVIFFERNTRFRVIQEIRAEKIAEFYGVLEECRDRVDYYLKFPDYFSKDEKEKYDADLQVRLRALKVLFVRYRIYFSDGVSANIVRLIELMERTFWRVAPAASGVIRGTGGNVQQLRNEYEEFVKCSAPIGEQLHGEFQRLVGVRGDGLWRTVVHAWSAFRRRCDGVQLPNPDA